MATSYQLTFSDPTNTATIEVLGVSLGPGKNNYSTSLDLIGPGYVNYGQDTSQNFLKLLENFSGPNPPPNAIKGQLWYDTSNPNRPVLRINNGSITSNRWPAATGIYQQTSDPDLTYTSNVKVGDIWVDTRSNQLKIRSSGEEWVIVGPSLDTGASKSGSEVSVLESNTGSFYPVVLNWANGKVVEVISYNSFVPKIVIDGFSSIKSGTTLTARSSARYNGIAESAASLYLSPGVTVSANNVLKNRSPSAPQVHTGTFIVESIPGLGVKNPVTNEQVKIYSTTTEAFISYTDLSSSALRIGIGTGTESVSYIRFLSNGNVGVNNSNPLFAFDVNGTGHFENTLTVSSSLVVENGASFGNTVSLTTLTASESATISKGISIGGDDDNTSLIPLANDTYDIGSALYSFRDLYVSNIRSGSGRIEIYGTVSTATQLENTQEFSIVGHVASSSAASFDGTSNVEISVEGTPELITGASVLTETTSSLNLLVCDTEAPDDLKQISKVNFLSDVYNLVFQPGMIIPYTTSTFASGSSLETNFFFCNGDEKLISDEQSLYNVVGDKYGSATPGYFKIPNLTTATVADGGYAVYYIIKR